VNRGCAVVFQGEEEMDAGSAASAFAHDNNKRRTKKSDPPARQKLRHLSRDEQTLIESINEQLEKDSLPVSRKICPECNNRFVTIRLGNTPVDTCRHCQGLWFDAGGLAKVSGFSQDIPGDHLKSRKSRFKCPVCSTVMRECVFLRKHNLLADECPNKHGVYLEKGELQRLFEIV
jgi:Zn-finger nucleic acid-binding protein